MSASSFPPPPSKSPWKIVLFVVLGLVGLCIVCCLVTAVPFAGFGKGMAAVEQAVRTKYGTDARFDIDGNGEEWTLSLGVSRELTPEETVEAQDWIWRTYATQMADSGLPVTQVVVGKPRRKGVKWDEKDIVRVEKLIERTGVPVPERPWWLPEEAGGHIRVNVESEPDEQKKEEDAPR